MRLIRYRDNNKVSIGLLHDDHVIDLDSWWQQNPASANQAELPESWDNVLPLLLREPHSLDHYLHSAPTSKVNSETIELLPPLLKPGKIIAVGTNYLDHAQEVGRTLRTDARLLGIFPSSLHAPYAPITLPSFLHKFDFEAELAVVIGQTGKQITQEQAMKHVFGYMVSNDLSAREYQFDIQPPQTTRAKSIDGFTPIGPWLCTQDEIPDPHDLSVQCWVNDELMQSSNTRYMLHRIPALIEQISKEFTLHTGDIILTGTPSGCGAFRSPPVYLKSGDRVKVAIERLGHLSNQLL